MRRVPIVRLLLAGALAIALILLAANVYVVLLADRGDWTDKVTEAPAAQTAIVLGAEVRPDGSLSRVLGDRVTQAARLWDAGKVDRILVTGARTDDYDEPTAMREELVRRDVPPRVIFEDGDGLDTWASMVRADRIYGVDSAVVITQTFHMPRALYLAEANGLNASGLTSDLRPYGFKGNMGRVREAFSRVKAVGDVTLDRGVGGGSQIPISGPDGRVSWTVSRTVEGSGTP